MDQNKKSTFQKLDSLVEETRQIIQDTMILFERVESSAHLVYEMKKNLQNGRPHLINSTK